jgi:hypothetical protein
LIGNQYYEIKNSIPNQITADKPIEVIQYMTSETCDSRNPPNCGGACPYPGDPEIVTINPLEQTISNVTVISARNDLTPPNTNIRTHYINIIMNTAAIADSGFIAIAYGFGNVESYGYNAGTNVKDFTTGFFSKSI